MNGHTLGFSFLKLLLSLNVDYWNLKEIRVLLKRIETECDHIPLWDGAMKQ